MRHTCQGCGVPFHGRPGRIYHSKACANAHQPRGFRRECRQCREWFVAPRADHKFCSYECAHEFRRKRVTIKCEQCQKEFKRKPYQVKRRFCSVQCSGRWHKLNPSPITRARQSAAAKRFNARRRPIVFARVQMRMKNPSDPIEAYYLGRKASTQGSWESGHRVGFAAGYERALLDMRGEMKESA